MDADIRVGDTVAFNHPDEGRKEGIVKEIDGNQLIVEGWLSLSADEMCVVPIDWLTVPF